MLSLSFFLCNWLTTNFISKNFMKYNVKIYVSDMNMNMLKTTFLLVQISICWINILHEWSMVPPELNKWVTLNPGYVFTLHF